MSNRTDSMNSCDRNEDEEYNLPPTGPDNKDSVAKFPESVIHSH
jgi:hypothetical protein